jgi:hypothetical protein
MPSKLKAFVTAAVLFLAFVALGVAAVKSSDYMDVSELANVKRESKVTVKGRLADLSYDPAKRKLYLVLEGRNGYRVLAVVDADYVERKYGPVQYLSWDTERVVVEGVYDPATRTLRVTEILQGCHSSYQQPAVTG